MGQTAVIILGGGLAGLTSALHLNRAGVACAVIERKRYPFHRVCGEYVSNEVLPYLNELQVDPFELGPSRISRFQLTSTNGRSVTMPLDLGGFGISRFAFDYFLYQKAVSAGVTFYLESEVKKVVFGRDEFLVETEKESLTSPVVIGAFGKRSHIDYQLSRKFLQRRSPYVGVKYHIHLQGLPNDLIALHNFELGYCGISHVENNKLNLCYLTHRDHLRRYRSVKAMEDQILSQNPFLKSILHDSEFLTEAETINEITFEPKSPVEQHILMAGDAAGMITPLCGNGMAMAIHGAKIVSEHVMKFLNQSGYSRQQMESDYAKALKQQFARRLWIGRRVQRLFGSSTASNFAVDLARHLPAAANWMMHHTHGKPF